MIELYPTHEQERKADNAKIYAEEAVRRLNLTTRTKRDLVEAHKALASALNQLEVAMKDSEDLDRDAFLTFRPETGQNTGVEGENDE